MDNQELIEKEAINSITEYLKDRSVLLAEGTGNLLKIDNKFYIVTCKHVADKFMKHDTYRYAVLRDNNRIMKENLSYLGATNDEIDIAILGIKDEFIYRAYSSLEDFEIIEDFSQHNWQHEHFILYGTPGDLVQQIPEGYGYEYLRYITVASRSKNHSKNFLYLDYREKVEVINDLNGEVLPMPHPSGLSGTFIYTLPIPKLKKEEIFNPYFVKIIAVQSAYSQQNNYLKASNVSKLFELMKKLNIM